MLQTDEFWEDVEGTRTARKLRGSPGLRQYWCFEIPVNVQVFHVDILNSLGGETDWSRLIYDNIRWVLPILKANRPCDVRLSLQTRREDLAAYRITAVNKILAGTIAPGFENYAFICSGDTTYFESSADLSVGEFKNARVIWSNLR